jgi:hypothetical protein
MGIICSSTHHFENGDTYKGQWKNGTLHGQGEYTWKNGNSFRGTWENGFRRCGIMVFHDIRLIGTWKDGKFWDGERRYTWKNNFGVIQFDRGDHTGDVDCGKFFLPIKDEIDNEKRR